MKIFEALWKRAKNKRTLLVILSLKWSFCVSKYESFGLLPAEVKYLHAVILKIYIVWITISVKLNFCKDLNKWEELKF